MDILKRLLTAISYFYITGKWLGLIGWLVTSASLSHTEGGIFWLTKFGFQMMAILIVPLVLLSIFEWIVFGTLTWRVSSFSKKTS